MTSLFGFQKGEERRPGVRKNPSATRTSGLAQCHPLISTKCPAFAAAAIAGETRWVRLLKLWRSSKLRFDAEAQRGPGCVGLGRFP